MLDFRALLTIWNSIVDSLPVEYRVHVDDPPTGKQVYECMRRILDAYADGKLPENLVALAGPIEQILREVDAAGGPDTIDRPAAPNAKTPPEPAEVDRIDMSGPVPLYILRDGRRVVAESDLNSHLALMVQQAQDAGPRGE